MKKFITLTFAASTLFLAGCCTTMHVTKWEYKVVAPTMSAIQFGGATNAPASGGGFPEMMQRRREARQEFLNQLGKDGWILVSEDEGTFYLKRPIK